MGYASLIKTSTRKVILTVRPVSIVVMVHRDGPWATNCSGGRDSAGAGSRVSKIPAPAPAPAAAAAAAAYGSGGGAPPTAAAVAAEAAAAQAPTAAAAARAEGG
jgi:hypothetical protein